MRKFILIATAILITVSFLQENIYEVNAADDGDPAYIGDIADTTEAIHTAIAAESVKVNLLRNWAELDSIVTNLLAKWAAADSGNYNSGYIHSQSQHDSSNVAPRGISGSDLVDQLRYLYRAFVDTLESTIIKPDTTLYGDFYVTGKNTKGLLETGEY